MRPVSEKEVLARGRYWAGRWPYHEAAIRMAMSVNPHSVLEIGTKGGPAFHDSDTMGLEDSAHIAHITHNCTHIPWPGGNWDVVMALQVWEHLEGGQRVAMAEALRRANRAVVLSFPYMWAGGDANHRGITDGTIAGWALDIEPTEHVIIDNPSPRYSRMVCMWRK